MIPTSGLILRHGGESEQRTKDRKEPAPAAIKEVTKEQGDKLEAHARERNESEGSEVSTRCVSLVGNLMQGCDRRTSAFKGPSILAGRI
jgi:hypothetical protein